MFLAGVSTVVHVYHWLHRPVEAVVSAVKNTGKQHRAEEPESVEFRKRSLPNNMTTILPLLVLLMRRRNETWQGHSQAETTMQKTFR
jgi:hypothetical protein